MNKEYDYVIAGSGLAGLSLAYYMHTFGVLKSRNLLLIDQVLQKTNDKTWSFWHADEPPFASLSHAIYEKMYFESPWFTNQSSISPFKYYVIQSIDFYKFVLNQLGSNENIHWLEDKVVDLQDKHNEVKIITEDHEIRSSVCFNSTLRNKIDPLNGKYTYLLQHFAGWVVETKEDTVDPNVFTIHDFAIPQEGRTQFMYLLPFSKNRFLLEFTVFSEKVLEKGYYEDQLRNYLDRKLHVDHYEIKHHEFGVIPMTDYPFQRKQGRRIFNIGTASGAIKASSGYGFLRIVSQARQIAERVKAGKEIVVPKSSNWVYGLLDSVMLKILRDHGDLGAEIFSHLFQKNPPQRVLRFLDERCRGGEILKIMQSMPNQGLFRKEFFSVLLRHFK